MKQRILNRVLLAAAIAFPLVACAQAYPTKPVRIIVPHPPGGNTDAIARMVADRLKGRWNQVILVENRPGASGNIGAEVASKAPGDGYTLMITVSGVVVINKSLYAKLNHDPDTFVPVSVIGAVPLALTVGPKVTASSVQALIEFAKANPGKLNYASGGTGNVGHLASEFFKLTTGLTMVYVPYNGITPAIIDLMSGQVDMLFVEPGLTLSHVRQGKLRILAVGSEQRNPLLPEVPTMSEVLPGFVVADWFGMLAPPGTPAATANTVSAAVAEVLKQPDIAKRMTDIGVDVVGSTPAEMGRRMSVERERWGQLVRSLGLKVE